MRERQILIGNLDGIAQALEELGLVERSRSGGPLMLRPWSLPARVVLAHLGRRLEELGRSRERSIASLSREASRQALIRMSSYRPQIFR